MWSIKYYEQVIISDFCIEFYSHHIQKSSNEVFALFEREGVLDLLCQEYRDLHGMGMEYMMQLLDEYLGREKVEG